MIDINVMLSLHDFIMVQQTDIPPDRRHVGLVGRYTSDSSEKASLRMNTRTWTYSTSWAVVIVGHQKLNKLTESHETDIVRMLAQ